LGCKLLLDVVKEELSVEIADVKVAYTVRLSLIGDLGNLQDVPSPVHWLYAVA